MFSLKRHRGILGHFHTNLFGGNSFAEIIERFAFGAIRILERIGI